MPQVQTHKLELNVWTVNYDIHNSTFLAAAVGVQMFTCKQPLFVDKKYAQRSEILEKNGPIK